MKPESVADSNNSPAASFAQSKKSVSVEYVQQYIRSAIQTSFEKPNKDTEASETIDLAQALGRVLTQDLISPLDVPPHHNAAMDGYALRSQALQQAAEHGLPRLKIVGTVLAGSSALSSETQDPLSDAATCIRIMTGAVMPEGYDTVIPQELVSTIEAESILIDPSIVKAGANRRLRGEDLQQGQIVLSRGRILQAADIGLIASLGHATVQVKKQITVAIFSTGDELSAPGTALPSGHIYDSNRYTLHALLQQLHCKVLDLGMVPDQPEALHRTFSIAIQSADVILTSGGVSAGIADFTKQTMATFGQMQFWNIDMRPGRPLAFGQVHVAEKSAFLFGLPGNPVATMIAFYFFVRDALFLLMQSTPPTVPRLPAVCTHTINKRKGRVEFQRGIVKREADSTLTVSATAGQGSAMLKSMSDANCIIVLPAEQSDIHAGQAVEIILLDSLNA